MDHVPQPTKTHVYAKQQLMTVETRGARRVVDVGQQLVALLDA